MCKRFTSLCKCIGIISCQNSLCQPSRHFLRRCVVNFLNSETISPISCQRKSFIGCETDEQYKTWAARVCCMTFSRLLTDWPTESRQMPIAVPIKGFYLCLKCIFGITAKSKHTVQYPDLPQTVRPVLRCEESGSVPQKTKVM
jgi:hypothetical protein